MKILLIFISCFLLAGAVSAQDNATPQAMKSASDDVWGDKGFALGKELHGTEYKNSFGRRLANTVVFLVNYKKLLANIPLAGYSLQILDTKCKEDVIPGQEDVILGQIALIYKKKEMKKFKGVKLASKGSSSPITLRSLCAWIEELKIEDLKDYGFFGIEQLGQEVSRDELYILMEDPLQSNIADPLWVERSAFR